ncbi:MULTISPECIES: hypothetical protein [unclassified Burkholderia]|uniref:hypothetical protein n=1 Tax=unclassified Burkholderia TaxID=2613784 RepID=UPI000F57E318|nr:MULTISPECIES: hypothetical protein [unclassified Burkholderia]RQR87670.1 hypothetical protein DIE10_06155 [Burkholderia sp. Bp9011]
MSIPIAMIVLPAVIIGLLFVNMNFYSLVRRSWKREKQALDALENLKEASTRYQAILEERIQILEGALRERGVNI